MVALRAEGGEHGRAGSWLAADEGVGASATSTSSPAVALEASVLYMPAWTLWSLPSLVSTLCRPHVDDCRARAAGASEFVPQPARCKVGITSPSMPRQMLNKRGHYGHKQCRRRQFVVSRVEGWVDRSVICLVRSEKCRPISATTGEPLSTVHKEIASF